MNIISGCKKLCHLVFSSIKLIYNNLVLSVMLVLLVTAAEANGIITMSLLSFFDDGPRLLSWYIHNLTLVLGWIVSLGFVLYLARDILAKQTKAEVAAEKAEYKIRANEEEFKGYSSFNEKPSVAKRLLRITKTDLLHLPWKKDE